MTQTTTVLIPGYTVGESVGSGSMGQVWRARHDATGAPVAIKRLPMHDSPKAMALREAEIRATAGLDHRHIVRSVDTGSLPDGSQWLALEWCGAGTFADLEDWEQVCRATTETLEALAHAHAHHVLHRDVKPGNILQHGSGDWKLADFGVAHIGTSVSAIQAGTPNNMAPEVASRDFGELGPPTDLYGLACTVWEVVTGGPLFEGSVGAVLRAQISSPPPPFVPRFEVPDWLESWLHALLQKAPSDRPGSAALALAMLQSRPAPRLPPRVRITTSPGRDTRLDDAGVSLLPFRPPPFLGRKTELQAVWEQLRRVDDLGRPHLVVLEGEFGTGRTRLATTIASENHRIQGGRWGKCNLGTGGLSALTAVLGEAPSARAITAWSRGETAVLVLTDLTDSPAASALGEIILAVEAPVLFLVTATAAPQGLLRALPDNTAEVVPICPLDTRTMDALIRRILGLHAMVRSRLVQSANGNPGRAIESLHAWSDLGRYRMGRSGLELGPGPDRTDIIPLGSDPNLGLLAIAGGRLEVDLWSDTCKAAGTPLDWAGIGELTRSRRAYVEMTSRGLVFSFHPSEPWDLLASRAIKSSTSVPQCNALLDALQDDDPRRGMLLLGARRFHQGSAVLVEACLKQLLTADAGLAEFQAEWGLWAARLDPVEDGIQWRARIAYIRSLAAIGADVRALELTRRWQRDLPTATAEIRVDFWGTVAELYQFKGANRAAREALDRALATLESQRVDGHLHRLQDIAAKLVTLGDIGLAEELATEVLASGDPALCARARLILGRVSHATGDPQAALLQYHQAIALEDGTLPWFRMALYTAHAEALGAAGYAERAQEMLERAAEVAGQLDRPSTMQVDLARAVNLIRLERWKDALTLCRSLRHDPRVQREATGRAAVDQVSAVAFAGLEQWDAFVEQSGRFEEELKSSPELYDPDLVALARLTMRLLENAPEEVMARGRGLLELCTQRRPQERP